MAQFEKQVPIEILIELEEEQHLSPQKKST
jgi:hypothetical protein